MGGFVWSDVWVLLALLYAAKPAPRERIRGAGDYINHAAMTDDELDGGLDRLMAAGFASSAQLVGMWPVVLVISTLKSTRSQKPLTIAVREWGLRSSRGSWAWKILGLEPPNKGAAPHGGRITVSQHSTSHPRPPRVRCCVRRRRANQWASRFVWN